MGNLVIVEGSLADEVSVGDLRRRRRLVHENSRKLR